MQLRLGRKECEGSMRYGNQHLLRIILNWLPREIQCQGHCNYTKPDIMKPCSLINIAVK